jgi:hypothetical protein
MQRDTSLNVESVIREERKAIRGEGAGERPMSALCISGGGIRSATFALGALQGLAARGILQQFDYLSTVSGGGYIGSWLTAWVHRVGSIETVASRLRPDAPAPAAGEPNPVQHLREYNSYMAPRNGAFSADLWTVIATVARNIFLNWLVLIPLLLFALTIPRLYLSLLSFPERVFRADIFAGDKPQWNAPGLDVISTSPLVELAAPIASGMLLAIALFNILRYLPGIGGRDHTRFDYVIGILLPLGAAVLTFLVFDSLYYLGSNFKNYSNLISVILWTAVPFALAWLVYLPLHRDASRSRMRLVFSPLSLAGV